MRTPAGSSPPTACWPAARRRSLMPLFHFAFGLGEARIVYRYVVFGFLDLNREAPVGPGERPAERTFHAVQFAIIGVVDLRRVAAHRRFRVAHLSLIHISEPTRLG